MHAYACVHTQVPGSQLVTMTLDDLMADLQMSKLQAKRVLLNLKTRMAGGLGGGLRGERGGCFKYLLGGEGVEGINDYHTHI